MAAVDRKLELFAHLVRLRRAGRLMPGNDDLAAVRLGLERELGETVSRRLAARLLGVSHTALERWIESGDVPIVSTPAGRREIPVAALLDLYEAVNSEGGVPAGRGRLSSVLRGRQDEAARLRLDWSRLVQAGNDENRSARRGLAYHQAVASRLTQEMVADALYILYRWREQGRIDPRYAEPWERVLDLPLRGVRDAITAIGPDADDLRQNSPFAGSLSEPERRRVLAEVG